MRPAAAADLENLLPREVAKPHLQRREVFRLDEEGLCRRELPPQFAGIERAVVGAVPLAADIAPEGPDARLFRDRCCGHQRHRAARAVERIACRTPGANQRLVVRRTQRAVTSGTSKLCGQAASTAGAGAAGEMASAEVRSGPMSRRA